MTAHSALSEARRALEARDLQRCAQLLNQILAQDSGNAEAHFLIGMARAEAGRISAALPALDAAVQRDPQNAEYRAQYARLLMLARQEADARAQADAASALAQVDASASAWTLDTIGCVYARLSDHDCALPLFERAVARAADNVEFRYNLATTLGFFGRIDEAAREYTAILARAPHHGRAHLGLVALKRQNEQASPVPAIEAAIATCHDPIEALRMHYAAAKALDDIGDHAGVLRHLDIGNRAHKQRIGYSFDRDDANRIALQDGFERPEFFSTPCSTLTEAPIFVVGLPRTGTTLVDRILGAHPQVTALGELQAMPLAVKRLAQTSSRMVLDPETINASGRIAPEAVGRDYLARARQHGADRSERFTDKFPLNFFYIGHILHSLPHARIVCLRRDAMDSVWSNYKNLFATSSPYYGWSYDLMDTARFFLLFDELMAFWRAKFPVQILELGYEYLIANQEGETRRLLAHCGLDWDPACLDFHRADGAVATPSAQQVRKPLNSGSVGAWRHHAQAMTGVMELFRSRDIPVD